MDLLQEAPEYIRIRDVKEWCVDFLVEELQRDAGDHEELTPPFVAIASCARDDFRVRNISSYTFEVIGGVHHFKVVTKINELETKIHSRRCAVYGKGLSRNATRVLWGSKMKHAVSFIAHKAKTCCNCQNNLLEGFARLLLIYIRG